MRTSREDRSYHEMRVLVAASSIDPTNPTLVTVTELETADGDAGGDVGGALVAKYAV